MTNDFTMPPQIDYGVLVYKKDDGTTHSQFIGLDGGSADANSMIQLLVNVLETMRADMVAHRVVALIMKKGAAVAAKSVIELPYPGGGN